MGADPWKRLEMNPTIRTVPGAGAPGEEARSDPIFDTAEFRLHDHELRLSLTSRLYDHIDAWIERLGSHALILGSVRGRESRACFAAAMSFSLGHGDTRSMVFVELDTLTQCRRSAPRLIKVDRSEPTPDSVLPFRLLLGAVSISSPSCPGTRQVGLHQFGEIANTTEAPD
jgi:hypothetical protein